MPGNPLIPVGTLNRVRASVIWPNHPELNVTASFLGRMGIRFALEGDATLFIPAMAGVVTSQEPYMMVTATIHLLKSQQLAALYKSQMELSSLIGDGTVRGDSVTLPAFQILNAAIQTVRELSFAGDEADFAIGLRGYILVNSTMWD